jgi:xanthine dehydrogenase accessory factor
VGTALIVSQTIALLIRGEPCAWITVARTAGSAPREVGARMLITRNDALDTVGGGQLEYRAVEIARAMLQQLADNTCGAVLPKLERFPLSARVGQCCGGTVWLAIEALSSADLLWLRDAQESLKRNTPYPRMRTLTTQDDPHTFHDTLRETAPKVFLFGAGHVGCALATILSVNDLNLTWIDSRDAQFPRNINETTPQVLTIESESPVAEVANAPPHAYYLVMTHSHALDFDLIEAILKRGDAAFIGLIGSATKRAQFETRLHARGVSSEAIASITCPIGVTGISSKHPGAIASAVAAQLLHTFEKINALVTH